MAIYQIVKKGDSILRENARVVKEITPNIIKLLDNMQDTMYAANGVGLAAPQIGISKRVIIVDTGDELLELINPEVLMSEGEQTDTEGCLSVPGLVGDVTRAYKVKVRALNRAGNEIEITGEEITARALQHEIDHLDGVLFIDKAENIKTVE
ncbi:MAG: peptide deformylase [Firmicutes bacterium HGW-Firmicutes-12]|jgi:peptide deformylase|nr:MAG: peptide deformylase [Firmicutes bacterium HGW-Firmicutes-12]